MWEELKAFTPVGGAGKEEGGEPDPEAAGAEVAALAVKD